MLESYPCAPPLPISPPFLTHIVTSMRDTSRAKDGAVAEVGTHDILMAKKGLYHNLMSTQMAGYGAIDG